MSTSDNPYRPPRTAVADAPGAGPVDTFCVPGIRVGGGRGWAWIREGWTLLGRQTGMWVAAAVILAALNLLVARLGGEFLGDLLTLLLAPLVSAGLLAFAHGIARGEAADLGLLFIGLRQRTGTLVAVGLLGLLLLLGLALVLGLGVVVMLGGFAVLMSGNPGLIMDTLLAGGGLLGLLLLVPLVLLGAGLLGTAFWFAPGLVLYAGLGAWAALAESLRACLRNWLPFLVYGLALLVLVVIIAIPAGMAGGLLGLIGGVRLDAIVGLVVTAALLPLLMSSYYLGFRDIFGRQG